MARQTRSRGVAFAAAWARPFHGCAVGTHTSSRCSSFLHASRPLPARTRVATRRVPESCVADRTNPAGADGTPPTGNTPSLSSRIAAERDLPLGGPQDGPSRFDARRLGEGIGGDVRRRAPLYIADWTDGLRFKSIPAIMFLFFACLAPVVAFGGMMSALTSGAMGVVECIVACGCSGMLYAMFSGQPLTFLAPTGLTLAFTSALFGFCQTAGIPFLPTYAWVGVWTSIILFILAIFNACDLIKYCTRFTDDIFNSLIATNFIYEAARSLLAGFAMAGFDKTRPFTALALALGTFIVGRIMTGLRTSRFLFKGARNVLSDFGPCIAIAVMTLVAQLPSVAALTLERLAIPAKFELAGGRAWLIPLHLTPVHVRLLAIVPAILLTCLFFLDQNISVRVVNAPAHRLRKGPGYHLDMMLLAVCTFMTAILGLPMMCAGTVQSLTHVKALATYESVRDETGALTVQERIVSVQENRVTGFAIHALLVCSLLLLPVLQRIPMAVISGLFLYLGTNLFGGNEFLARIPIMFMDPSRYPPSMPAIPAVKTNMFTLLQLVCLATLWGLKLNQRTAMFFPAVIGTLMIVRSFVAPALFKPAELDALDGAVVEDDTEDTRPVPDADRPGPPKLA